MAITHPHADHYMGMRAIISAFSGRIDSLYTFPIKTEADYLKKLITSYKNFALKTDDTELQQRSLELAYILIEANSAVDRWDQPSGAITLLPIIGFPDVCISTLLPPSKVKGRFFQQVFNEEFEPERQQLNELSMAFLIEYAGQQIVLGGDGTSANWVFQNQSWARLNKQCQSAAVKLPHHGSKYDCTNTVLDILFGNRVTQVTNPIACISANGKTHPDGDVLNALVNRNIKPYCTNVSRRCGAKKMEPITSPEIDPALLKFINSASIDTYTTGQPCQGDITLELSVGCSIKVTTEHRNLCPLRGELNFLSSQAIQ